MDTSKIDIRQRNFVPEFTLGVSTIDHRERIETFLIRQFRNYTIFRMQRMVSGGAVKIRNRPTLVGERVRTGDEVKILLIEPPDKLYQPEEIPLSIHYEDPWLIVLEKPAGMVCHPVSSYQTGTVCNALQSHFDVQSQCSGILRPGIVHRLDRQTSGLLVVSKTHLAHRGLVEQFEKSEVRKEYLVVVEGVLQQNCGEILRPIGISFNCRTLASVDQSARKSKSARTDFYVENRFPKHTLLKAIPKTGRMHQIRVHLSSIGHPVVGDFCYGENVSNPVHRDDRSLNTTNIGAQNRHLLHAHVLKFRHPVFNRDLAFRLPIPDDLKSFLDDVKKKNEILHSC